MLLLFQCDAALAQQMRATGFMVPPSATGPRGGCQLQDPGSNHPTRALLEGMPGAAGRIVTMASTCAAPVQHLWLDDRHSPDKASPAA
jgi:hypothetical protein